MEMCDVHDESGSRTGRIVARGTELRQGEYYLVVHVWIRNEVGEYLVQQRAPNVLVYPGVWAATAGQVRAGEESIAAAIRETMEEVGVQLSPANLRRFDRLKIENRFEDLWLAEVSRSEIGTPTMGPEVSAWRWASTADLREAIKRGDFYAYSYFDSLPE